MAVKRKAETEFASQLAKVPRLFDAVEERSHASSSTYSDQGNESEDDQFLGETPTTPFSVNSRYPSELKTHLCPFDGCTKAFNRPARLQEHIRSHNNERIFKCTFDECEKTFLRASHLNHHIKSAHTAQRDYICDRPGCRKTFVTGTRLRRHIAAHDGRDKFRCTEYPPCNETFRKHSTLNKHILSAHLNQKPFPCSHTDPVTGEKCQHAFDTAAHLRGHENRVHAENRFLCTECSSQMSDASGSFASYAELQTHIKSVHPPQCHRCAFTCSSSRELRRHLEIAHGDVELDERRLFPCTYPDCGRSFTKKGNLTVHLRTVHEGEKRFICGETDLSKSKRVIGWTGDGCGKRYGSKLALEEHVRTAHLGLVSSKAARRNQTERENSHSRSKASQMSTMALLTGEGYADESGRHIRCFVEECEHRFYRDYDLWVHMSSKHGYTEDGIKDLFMQRALAVQHDEGQTVFGIYGLDLDPGYEVHSAPSFETTADVVGSLSGIQITNNEFDEKLQELMNVESSRVLPVLEDVAGANDPFYLVDPDLVAMDRTNE